MDKLKELNIEWKELILKTKENLSHIESDIKKLKEIIISKRDEDIVSS